MSQDRFKPYNGLRAGSTRPPCCGQPLALGDLGRSHLGKDTITVADGSSVALSRRQGPPLVSLYFVLRNALASAVHEAEIVLGIRIALFSRNPP